MAATQRFEKCKKEGKYDAVGPGERCTIDAAMRLGIFDENAYVKDSPAQTDTWTSPDRRPYRLCSAESEKDVAYPLCIIENGMPYKPKPGDASKCIVSSCPPTFEPAASAPGVCAKPTANAVVSAQAHCSERSEDWYSVPNYHLGNKYVRGLNAEKESTCFAPCQPGKVPFFAIDPVDNAKSTLVDRPVNQLDQCMDKSVYFGGKYKGTSDFCPIAWVKRLSASPSSVKIELVRELDALNGERNSHREKLYQEAEYRAQEIVDDASCRLENIEAPNSPYMVAACKRMNTPQRVNEAYEVCKQAFYKPDDILGIYRKSGLTRDLQDKKLALLRQSCNALFCGPNSAAGGIGKPAMCLANVPKLKEDELKALDTCAASRLDGGGIGMPTVAYEVSERVPFFIKVGIIGIVIVCIAVVVVCIWTEFLWPYVIKPLIAAIRSYITKDPQYIIRAGVELSALKAGKMVKRMRNEMKRR